MKGPQFSLKCLNRRDGALRNVLLSGAEIGGLCPRLPSVLAGLSTLPGWGFEALLHAPGTALIADPRAGMRKDSTCLHCWAAEIAIAPTATNRCCSSQGVNLCHRAQGVHMQ